MVPRPANLTSKLLCFRTRSKWQEKSVCLSELDFGEKMANSFEQVPGWEKITLHSGMQPILVSSDIEIY